MSLPLRFTCSGSYVFRSRIEEKLFYLILWIATYFEDFYRYKAGNEIINYGRMHYQICLEKCFKLFYFIFEISSQEILCIKFQYAIDRKLKSLTGND